MVCFAAPMEPSLGAVELEGSMSLHLDQHGASVEGLFTGLECAHSSAGPARAEAEGFPADGVPRGTVMPVLPGAPIPFRARDTDGGWIPATDAAP